MTDPTGIAATTKTLFALAKAAGNVQLHEKIVELAGMLNEAVAENTELHAEIAQLKEKAAIQASLQYRHGTYWTGDGDGDSEGPYCTRCWDDERKLIRMHTDRPSEDSGCFQCPKCHVPVTVFEAKFAVWRARLQRGEFQR